jgi:hypothetical protein
MFRKASILCVFVAVLSLMAHIIIPHHEHGEIICFEQLHAETASSSGENGSGHFCCFSEQRAILTPNGHSVSGNRPVCCSFHFPPLLLFWENFFDFNATLSLNTCKPYYNFYTSALLASIRALRAPPQG